MNPIQAIQLTAVSVILVLIIVVATTVGFIARKNGKNGSLWRQMTGLALIISAGTAFAWIYFVNPLPSDETMIEHFNQNRPVYEELATGFVQAIKNGNEETKVWMASPHTLELKKIIAAKDERNKLEKDQWFDGVRANVDLPGYEDKGSIEFWIENGFKFSWREMNSIWKIYIYFPEIKPETEGKLACPVGTGNKCLGDMGIPILQSLNGYPQFYKARKRNCGAMARKIDDHWYLLLDRAC